MARDSFTYADGSKYEDEMKKGLVAKSVLAWLVFFGVMQPS
ncbi:MAG: hypothetical protein SCJ97_04400 [Bacillota bacterium]|nr:hypothetical protein [Bacillota bacterium]